MALGTPIATAGVEVRLDLSKLTGDASQVSAELHRQLQIKDPFASIAVDAKKAGDNVQDAFAVASKQSGETLGNIASSIDAAPFTAAGEKAGGAAADRIDAALGTSAALWDEIDAAAERAGEGVQDSFVEAGRQSNEALDKIGGPDVWGDVPSQAESAGEDVQSSFVEAARQSDDALDKIGGTEVWGDVERQAERTGESVEASFREAARQSNEHLGTIGATGATMLRGLATLAATIGIGFFLKDSVDQATDANKVLGQTNQLLLSTGGAAGFTADQLQDMAQNLSLKIGVDDDDILSASNVLLTFKSVTGDTFETAMGAAADMSAVFGGDLNSSVTQLGKALQDPVKGISALSRVGVSFTQEQKDQIKTMVEAGDVAGAQGVILGELAGEVGGAAEASATGTEKMGVAFGNLKEALGGGITAALEGITPAIVSLFDSLQPTLATLGDSIGVLIGPLAAAFGPALATAMGIISTVLGDFGSVLTSIAPLVEPLVKVFGVFATLLSGVIASAFRALGPSIQQIAEFLGPLADVIGTTLNDALEAIQPMITTVADVFSGVLAEILPIITQMFVDLAPSIIEIATILGGAFATALPQLARAFGEIVKTLAPAIPLIVQGFLPTLRALAPVLPIIIDAIIAWTVAQALFNIVMAANPIILVGIAIVGLIGGVKAAYDHFQAFHDIVDTTWQTMQSVWDFIVNFFVVMWHDLDGAIHTVIDTFTNLPGQIGDVLSAIGDFVTGLPGMILDMVEKVVGAFVDLGVRAAEAVAGLAVSVVTTLAGLAVQAVEAVAKFVEDAVIWYYSLPIKAAIALANLAGSVLGPIADMAGQALSAVGSWVGNMLSGIGEFITGIPGAIGDIAGTIVGIIHDAEFDGIHAVEHLVTGALGAIGDFVTGIPGALLGAGSALVSGLRSALKSAWNTVIDSLPSFHAGLGPLPDVNLSMDFLKLLARGDIVDEPTIALIGERRRREVVVPTTMPGRAMELMQASGIGAMWDRLSQGRVGGNGGPLVSFPNATIHDATDVDLVAQKVGLAVAIRSVNR